MIGVFDSGSGGLSVLHSIHKQIPSHDIVYFGDIKNAPYGEKSPEELSELTVNAIRFLQERSVTGIVSACNSVSASLVLSLFDEIDFSSEKIVEMIGPTISYFREQNERIILCATPATVHSGLYQNGFHLMGKKISTIAIPELAGAIEFGASEEKLEKIIHTAFEGVSFDEFDTLVLGCTHYPLIMQTFSRVLGKKIQLFDPSGVVAQRVVHRFELHKEGTGTLRFFITKDSKQFRERVEKLFPQSDFSIKVVK